MKRLNEIQQNKIIALTGNYRTYSNIKEVSSDPDFKIPELFNEQYNYFEALSIEDIEVIKNVNDSDILNKTEFSEKVIELAENFHDTLRVMPKQSFDHNWKELEHDINVM